MQANGVTIAYTDTGAPPDRPDAPTVVFGHGLLFSGWMFHAQVEALRGDFRCVTIDWRGQGETPATADGYDMDTLSQDAIGLIEQLGVAPVHFVGLSMGGFVGMRIGARRGDLLRTLTLLDTSADPEEPKAARQDKLLAAVYRLVGMRPVASQVKPIMFGPTFRADPAGKPVIEEFFVRIGRCDRAGMRKAVLAVANRQPIYDEIDRITVPTLMIVGADDVPTPVEKARRIAARIPNARLEIVPDAGHSSTVEQPDAITKLLVDFLT
jgi:pimeloyl-ACP methyl ester carboxylesterase